MIGLLVTDRAGCVHRFEARTDITLMEAIRDAGVGDMLAICGGCMACATCHVYLDETLLDRLSPPSVPERRILAGLDFRRPTSRLACQIEMGEAGAELSATIAPSE